MKNKLGKHLANKAEAVSKIVNLKPFNMPFSFNQETVRTLYTTWEVHEHSFSTFTPFWRSKINYSRDTTYSLEIILHF